MKTLANGERNFCRVCGEKLVETESITGAKDFYYVRCPRWETAYLEGHDNFVGRPIPESEYNFDSITGKRIK